MVDWYKYTEDKGAVHFSSLLNCCYNKHRGDFQADKTICPRCKSWEYCKFRFLNNKRRCKKLQPRYICRRCNKYFTLGGKLYNTSLQLSSEARIFPNSCPCNVVVASPPCDRYGAGNSSNRLHTQPLDSFWTLRTDMTGTIHPYGNNLCNPSFLDPSSVINEGSCNGSLGMWSPQDGGSSQIYDTTCFRPCDSQSSVELLPFTYQEMAPNLGINHCLNNIPFTYQENSVENVIAPNLGINHCLNNIPPFSNIESMELEDSDGCLRLELLDLDFAKTPNNPEFDAHYWDAFEGSNLLDLDLAETPNNPEFDTHDLDTFEGSNLLDLDLAETSNNPEFDAHDLDDFEGTNLLDLDLAETPNNPYDAHDWDAFEGADCKVDDIVNLWMNF